MGKGCWEQIRGHLGEHLRTRVTPHSQGELEAGQQGPLTMRTGCGGGWAGAARFLLGFGEVVIETQSRRQVETEVARGRGRNHGWPPGSGRKGQGKGPFSPEGRPPLLGLGAGYHVRGAVRAKGPHPCSRRRSLPRHPRAGGLIFPFAEPEGGGSRGRREAAPRRGGGSGRGAGESGGRRGGPGGHTLKLPARDRKSRGRPAPHSAAGRAPRRLRPPPLASCAARPARPATHWTRRRWEPAARGDHASETREPSPGP